MDEDTRDRIEAAIARGDYAAAEAIAGRLRAGATVAGAWVRFVRSSTGLSQSEFAARYTLPVGTTREWDEAGASRTPPPSPCSA
jgi:DNA-binding transcriptional regulator YiaG